MAAPEGESRSAPGADEGRKERRIPYAVVWTLFAAFMLAGATLLLSPGLHAFGVVLLVLPIAALVLVTGAYFLVERARAR